MSKTETAKHTPGVCWLDSRMFPAQENSMGPWVQIVIDTRPSMFLEFTAADQEDIDNECAWKPGEMDANARRFVACWNACMGIPTEALEAGAVKELLEACEEALNIMEVDLQLEADDDPTVKILRAAIAKAKPKGE